jgi:hypothetical protein
MNIALVYCLACSEEWDINAAPNDKCPDCGSDNWDDAVLDTDHTAYISDLGW